MICTFVRHGESVSNKDGKMQGKLNPPLSDKGKEQASIVASHLKRSSFNQIKTSKLERAKKTAEIILDKNEKGGEAVPEDMLREFDLGKFAGKTMKSAKRHYKELFRPPDRTLWEMISADEIPGQEPFQSLCRRVELFFLKLYEDYPRDKVLVVGHKGFFECFMAQTIGYPLKKSWFRIDNASISVFEIRGNSVTFHTINDTSHIKNDSSDFVQNYI